MAETADNDIPFASSSMNVVELNNLVVSLRSTIRKAKAKTIQKLIRQMKRYKNSKGSDEVAETKKRKADRLLQEISALKKINIDKVAKYCLGNVATVSEAAATGDTETKVCTRISCCKSVQTAISKWREQHSDWTELAAFARSKNTGRRFKKKKAKSSSVPGKSRSHSAEGDNSVLIKSQPSDNAGENNESMDIDSDSVDSDANDDVGEDAVTNVPLQQLSNAMSASPKITVSKSKRKRDNDSKPQAELHTERQAMDSVGDELTLDNLSDDDMPNADVNIDTRMERKKLRSFFVVSDAEDDDSDADGEIKGSSNVPPHIVEDRRTEDHDAVINTFHATSSYAYSLRASNKSKGKKQMHREFDKARGHFPNSRGGKYPSSRGRFSGVADYKRPTVPSSKSGRYEVGGYKGNNGKYQEKGTRDDKRNVSRQPVPTKPADHTKATAEVLHPSWQASKKRKEQEKNTFVFQGTKKTFDDD